jgi:hypothetical protein
MKVTRPREVGLKSSHPLALASLTRGRDLQHHELVEWTSVRRVRYKRTGEDVVRHTLSPITPNCAGIYGVGPLPGIGMLLSHDVGRTLVVDVSLDLDHEVDVKVTD